MTNALGTVIAVLQEYNFTKKGDNSEQFTCKLYKTKEGNWYEIEDTNNSIVKGIIRNLKSAVDEKENKVQLHT